MYAVTTLVALILFLWGSAVWATFTDEEPYSRDTSSESDREAAWAVELQARIQAYERVEVTAVPAEDALAQVRAARGKTT